MRVNDASIIAVLILFGWVVASVLGARADVKWAFGAFTSFFLLFYVAGITIWFVIQAKGSERLLREIFASAPALPAPVETGVPYR